MAPTLPLARDPIALPAYRPEVEIDTGLPVIADPVRWHPLTWRQIARLVWRWFGQFLVLGMLAAAGLSILTLMMMLVPVRL